MTELAHFRASKGLYTAYITLYRASGCSYLLVCEVPDEEFYIEQEYVGYGEAYLRFIIVVAVMLDWAGDAIE